MTVTRWIVYSYAALLLAGVALGVYEIIRPKTTIAQAILPDGLGRVVVREHVDPTAFLDPCTYDLTVWQRRGRLRRELNPWLYGGKMHMFLANSEGKRWVHLRSVSGEIWIDMTGFQFVPSGPDCRSGLYLGYFHSTDTGYQWVPDHTQKIMSIAHFDDPQARTP